MDTSNLPQPSLSEENPRPDKLTLRQQEIFLAHGRIETVGMPYKQLAGYLNIPYNTLKAHLLEIRRKLNLQSRSELTYHACQIIENWRHHE